jgi:DNA-binding SARP family transcriptional activator
MAIECGRTPVLIPSGRQRALLAVLAARANETLNPDHIAELMWDGRPPSSEPRTVLRNHVMRLRRQLGEDLGRRVVTRPTGYAIELVERESDLLEFGALYQRAAAVARAGSVDHLVDDLAVALTLWRGEPFTDVPCHTLLERESPRLEQQHTELLEWHFDARIARRQHAQIIGELRDAVMRYPLHEKFRAQLMVALLHGGRRAEALAEYQAARRYLTDELGIEPGIELRRLQREILSDTDQVTVDERHSTTARAPVTPRQLPGAVRGFVGRGEAERQRPHACQIGRQSRCGSDPRHGGNR